MTREEKIEKISDILNDTVAYKKINEILDIPNDSPIWGEMEEFLVDKALEYHPEDAEFNVEAQVEVYDEDGDKFHIKNVEVNVFASDEDKAESKAEDNIREQNPEWEDCSIDIITVNEI